MANALQIEFLNDGVNKNGEPLVGGFVFFYEAGTLNVKNVYTDAAKTNPTFIVNLGADGRPQEGGNPTALYAEGNYRIIIKDLDLVTYLDLDNMYYAVPTVQLIDTVVLSITPYNAPSSSEVILVTTGALAITINLPAASTSGVEKHIKKVDNGAGIIIINRNGTDLIQGNTSITLTTENESIDIVADGSASWEQISGTYVKDILTVAGQTTLADVKVEKTQVLQKGSDIASVDPLVLSNGNYFDITGAVTITSIATKGIGTVLKLHFDAALILTHHATDLILIGEANIVTASGDEFEFVEYATGKWRQTTAPRIVAFRGALVSELADQTIPNTTNTKITFGSESYDTDSIHDTGSNTERLTVPAGVSKVRINGEVQWDGDGTGYRRIKLLKDNTIIIPGSIQTLTGIAAELVVSRIVSAILPVSPGEYFEIQVYQNSGGNLDTLESWFAMEIIE